VTSNQPGPPDPSRRRALKLMGAVAVGGCVALLGSGLLSFPLIDTGSQTRATVTQSDAQQAGGGQASYARVKVRYFQMSSTLPGVTEEYFVLPDPATYGELRSAVISAHPAISSMMASMLVLADGIVAKEDTPLHAGDEVDFIPAMAGG